MTGILVGLCVLYRYVWIFLKIVALFGVAILRLVICSDLCSGPLFIETTVYGQGLEELSGMKFPKVGTLTGLCMAYAGRLGGIDKAYMGDRV